MTTIATLGLADPTLRLELARTVARRIDPADVDDVVQSTLAEALTSQALPRAEEEIRRFVFAILRHKVADWYRRRGREARPIELSAQVTEPMDASLDLLRWAEREVPPGGKRTFDWMMREGQGETLAEIAVTDGVPAVVVRQRVSRLRRLLRTRWAHALAAVGALAVLALLYRKPAPIPIATDLVPTPPSHPEPSEPPFVPAFHRRRLPRSIRPW